MWLILLLVAESLATGPEVTIEQGPLIGVNLTTFSGRGIFGFTGIPYAKPPAGKYRFAESVPADPWAGVYHATSHPSPCMQYSQNTYRTGTAVFGVEDCLYINVYTPRIPTPGDGSPLMDVIVYIHGGAFMFHYGEHHGPKYLLDTKDIVLVDFTYRLGPLGFLGTEDTVVPGNNGMKDQVQALKWIQKNIAAFGGNPASVTLTGTSAGGASVHYHYLSPLSEGLFSGGISMSGSALNSWPQNEKPLAKAIKIGTELGCPTNDTRLMIKCLRTRPASQIVATTKLFMPWLFNPYSPFGPVVETPSPNAFISEAPIDIITQGKVKNLPWMATYTSQEGLYPGAEFAGDIPALRELDQNWNAFTPYVLDFYATLPKEKQDEVSQTIRKHYLKDKAVEKAVPELIEMLGDRLFIADISKAAKLQAKVNTAPVYSYEFSYRGKHSASEALSRSNQDFGVSHADDTCYVFQRSDMNPTETEQDVAMMKTMVDLFASFAATRVPSFKGEKEPWPEVKPNLPDLALRLIESPTSAPVKKLPDAGQGSFWDSLGFAENQPAPSTVPTKGEL